MASTRYRCAVVGLGNMGWQHGNAYRQLPQAELVAGMDIDAGKAAEWGRKLDVDRLYTSIDEMLDRECPEMVSVCLYPDRAPDVVVQIASREVVKGMLVEKPHAGNMGDARRMQAACEGHCVIWAVNHQRRFSKWHLRSKAWLDEGNLGMLEKVWVRIGNTYPDPFVMATHYLDMMRFFCGDVAWVHGQISDIETENAHAGNRCFSRVLSACLGFTNGALGQMHYAENGDEIHLIGTQGELKTQLHGDARVLTYTGTEWTMLDSSGYGWAGWDAFAPSIAEVLSAIEEGREPINSGHEGTAALEILLAVYESARMRNRIFLPITQEANPLELLHEKRVSV